MCYPGPGLIRGGEVAFPVWRWAERIPGRCILRVYSRGVGAPEAAVPTPVLVHCWCTGRSNDSAAPLSHHETMRGVPVGDTLSAGRVEPTPSWC